MPRKEPTHVALGDKNSPPGWKGGTDEMQVMLTYEQVLGHAQQLQFLFVVSANFQYKEPAGDLCFEIQRDCTILFEIDKKLNSRWSEQYYFITGKSSYKHLYGCIEHIDERTFKIKAKYDASGPHDGRQSFNLNIDYGQIEHSGGKWSYIPITIDPDVGNPRPPGLRHNINGTVTMPLVCAVDE